MTVQEDSGGGQEQVRAGGLLTERSAADALVTAAETAGLKPGVPILLGPVADNAVFRFLPGVVGKVARSSASERARREVLAGRWLFAHGVPAARPLDETPEPIEASGHVVTFWHEVVGEMASTRELAELLKDLHRLPAPDELKLWPLDPFVRVEERITQGSGALSDEDVRFLLSRTARLQTDFGQATNDLPAAVIHGDPNRKNAIRDRHGRGVLLDLERFGLGPREWDLVVPSVYRRLGWYTEAEYDDFVDAYGWDVRTSNTFEVLASVRELRMTAWLVARLPHEPRLIDEASKRIASLRDPSALRLWTPGV